MNDGEARGGERSEEVGLEARLKRLEEIVLSLEGRELELGQAMELFQEGVDHIKRSEELLARAELQVEELLGGSDQGATRPFDAEIDEF